jgi:hypothetical protein
MKLSQKLLIGALGGLTPTLLIMYRLDYSDLLNTAEPGLVIGGCIKALMAAGFGALMVYLHRTEENVYKVFQLGIAAPGLLSILVTDPRPATPGTTTEQAVEVSMATPPAPAVSLGSLLVGTAMAQDRQGGWDGVGNGIRQSNGGGGDQMQVEQFTAPEEGFMTQMARGFTGALPANRFYVVHSSHATEAEAQQTAQSIGARVYKGSDPARPYNVVVRSQVSIEEARKANAALNTGTNTIIEVR